jgi:leucine dehydrogenase
VLPGEVRGTDRHPALGVFDRIDIAAREKLGQHGLDGLPGSIPGPQECWMESLHRAGAVLVVADVDPARTAAASKAFNAEVVPTQGQPRTSMLPP